jgi:hypothetical protein
MEGLGHTLAPDCDSRDAPQNQQGCVACRKDPQTVNRVVIGKVNHAVADAKNDIEPRQRHGGWRSDAGSIDEKASYVEQLGQFQQIHVVPVWKLDAIGYVFRLAKTEVVCGNDAFHARTNSGEADHVENDERPEAQCEDRTKNACSAVHRVLGAGSCGA